MGPFIAVQVFGAYRTNSQNKVFDVRQVCEDHIIEDLGRIPTVSDFLNLIPESEISNFAYRKGKKITPRLDD